jgi:lysophospholipase L1-like esterase
LAAFAGGKDVGRMIRLRLILVVVFLVLAVAPGAAAEPAVTGYPDSMASTGDSITRAFNTCTLPFIDCVRNSWATGTSTAVNSHYLRILSANPAISGRNHNDAVSGAEMSELQAQAQRAVGQGVEYVTILMGANDACASSEAGMTPVATYRAQFAGAMTTLSAGLPSARIYVVSVPDLYRLWEVYHDSFAARTTWSLFRICQSMLARPGSTAQADVDRRNRIRQRVIDYNAQLAEVCAAYVHCRYDGNAVFNADFVRSDVSTRDYFHPSVAGQAKAAAVTWAAGFDFTDGVPPSSSASTATAGGGTTVTISATDNAGVSGVEYRLAAGDWTRYEGPVSVPTGTTLTWRAVDVNGNVEATHTLTG